MLYAIEARAANNMRWVEKVQDISAENRWRLETIEDMLGHPQSVLDDIQVNKDADERSGDQGQHNGGASARGKIF